MAVNLVQSNFRVRNDHTSISRTASWAAALNTNCSIPILTPFRIVFAISNTGSTNSASNPFQIYASRNGGAYSLVTTSSAYVIATDAANGNDANNLVLTTSEIGGTGAFQSAGVYNDTGATSSVSITAGDFTEFAFGLQFTSSCLPTDNFQFQVYFNSAPLNNYSQTPTIALASTGSFILLGNTYDNGGSSGFVNLYVPSTVINGDLMLALVQLNNSSASGTVSTPSGWTYVVDSGWSDVNYASGYQRIYVFQRTASSEPAYYSFTNNMGAVGGTSGYIFGLRGAAASSINATNSAVTNGYATSLSIPSLSETYVYGEMYVSVEANQFDTDFFSPPAGASILLDDAQDGAAWAMAFYMPLSAAGTFMWTFNSSIKSVAAVGFTIKPAWQPSSSTSTGASLSTIIPRSSSSPSQSRTAYTENLGASFTASVTPSTRAVADATLIPRAPFVSVNLRTAFTDAGAFGYAFTYKPSVPALTPSALSYADATLIPRAPFVPVSFRTSYSEVLAGTFLPPAPKLASADSWQGIPRTPFVPVALRQSYSENLGASFTNTVTIALQPPSADGGQPRASFTPVALRQSYAEELGAPLIASPPSSVSPGADAGQPKAPSVPIALRTSAADSTPFPTTVVTTPPSNWLAGYDVLPRAPFVPVALRTAYTENLGASFTAAKTPTTRLYDGEDILPKTYPLAIQLRTSYAEWLPFTAVGTPANRFVADAGQPRAPFVPVSLRSSYADQIQIPTASTPSTTFGADAGQPSTLRAPVVSVSLRTSSSENLAGSFTAAITPASLPPESQGGQPRAPFAPVALRQAWSEVYPLTMTPPPLVAPPTADGGSPLPPRASFTPPMLRGDRAEAIYVLVAAPQPSLAVATGGDIPRAPYFMPVALRTSQSEWFSFTATVTPTTTYGGHAPQPSAPSVPNALRQSHAGSFPVTVTAPPNRMATADSPQPRAPRVPAALQTAYAEASQLTISITPARSFGADAPQPRTPYVPVTLRQSYAERYPFTASITPSTSYWAEGGQPRTPYAPVALRQSYAEQYPRTAPVTAAPRALADAGQPRPIVVPPALRQSLAEVMPFTPTVTPSGLSLLRDPEGGQPRAPFVPISLRTSYADMVYGWTYPGAASVAFMVQGSAAVRLTQ